MIQKMKLFILVALPGFLQWFQNVPYVLGSLHVHDDYQTEQNTHPYFWILLIGFHGHITRKSWKSVVTCCDPLRRFQCRGTISSPSSPSLRLSCHSPLPWCHSCPLAVPTCHMKETSPGPVFCAKNRLVAPVTASNIGTLSVSVDLQESSTYKIGYMYIVEHDRFVTFWKNQFHVNICQHTRIDLHHPLNYYSASQPKATI